jgi:DNA topoisomerase-1
MKLVIVESPSKTRTLKRYLGSEYEIEASKGHVRDLAITGPSGYGVDIENDFKATYDSSSQKIKTIKNLKELSKKAEEVILATDPDREGEAIAWHIAQILGLDIETTKRLEFHEITRDSITEAIKAPRLIDMNLVNSQETRRVIDRIIGFDLSKITKKAIKSKSAGRVQSVTLKLICDHEKEILNFKPETYYSIVVELENENLKINITDFNGKKIDKIKSKEEAELIFNSIGDSLKVSDISVRERKVKSKEPYTTSTLQQDAFNHYNFKTKETQRIAQKLYEGVEIDEGLVGLITYMRTDSTKLSNSYIQRAKNYIIETYGEKYFVGEKNVKHVTLAQEAHEAIRPTSNHRTPDSIKEYLSDHEYKLYKLIYNRAQGSLMADEIDEVHTITLTSNGVNFKLEGYKVLFDGFSKLSKPKKEKFVLKNINLDDEFAIKTKDLLEDQTKPAPRYSEARVVKLMEEEGIGRPSTYASTINTLIERSYVVSEKGIIKPTEQGMITAKFLEGNFEDLMNVKYTAEMESKLDEIEAGKVERVEVLKDFYKSFHNEVEQYAVAPKLVVDKPQPKKTGEKCPECGADLVERKSKYGTFIACGNYPTCKYVKKEKKEIEYVGRKCPDCGNELVYRTSKKGRFIACSGFPKCRHMESIPEEANNEN